MREECGGREEGGMEAGSEGGVWRVRGRRYGGREGERSVEGERKESTYGAREGGVWRVRGRRVWRQGGRECRGLEGKQVWREGRRSAGYGKEGEHGG